MEVNFIQVGQSKAIIVHINSLSLILRLTLIRRHWNQNRNYLRTRNQKSPRHRHRYACLYNNLGLISFPYVWDFGLVLLLICCGRSLLATATWTVECCRWIGFWPLKICSPSCPRVASGWHIDVTQCGAVENCLLTS